MSGADNLTSDVVVITDFGALRMTYYKLVTADVAPSGIIIFLLLTGTKTLSRLIRPKNRTDFRIPDDERLEKLGERVF